MTVSLLPHKLRRRANHKRAAGTTAAVSFPAESPAGTHATSSRPIDAIVVTSKKSGIVTPLTRAPTFPLAAILWSARDPGSRWLVLLSILIVAALFRCATGLWGYSGYQRPPMHGDYEAQRHWMELTTQLPISQWYFHDLEWWGLDYPPLTAYHSWFVGRLGAWFGDPAWFGLYTSRGCDDAGLKLFMRASVLVSEFSIYVPAAVFFVHRFGRWQGAPAWNSPLALAGVMMQPATILIDHAYFQYNTVMLGLALASMSCILAGRFLWATVFFIAATAFKQMALYYFLPISAFLLGSCIRPRLNPMRFMAVVGTATAAAAVILLPLVAGTLYDARRGAGLYHDKAAMADQTAAALALLPASVSARLDSQAGYYPLVQQLVQMVHRVFPFARGLFEDKVANFWCAADVIFKLRQLPRAVLQRAALAATLAAAGPPSLVLLVRPRPDLLPLAMAASAWGFFLFSYQVHEKTVLLPLMPMTLLLAGRNGISAEVRAWVGLANLLGCWTMFPLLRRVELTVPYAVLSLLWAYLLGLPPTSWTTYLSYWRDGGSVGSAGSWIRTVVATTHVVLIGAMVIWHGLEASILPPFNKPDLWAVANVGIGALGFGLCYLWCTISLVRESGLLAGWSTSTVSAKPGRSQNQSTAVRSSDRTRSASRK